APGGCAGIAPGAGLPLVVGDLRARGRVTEVIERYRAQFRPSPGGSEPYVVVSGTVAVAPTEEAARRILVPEAWSLAHSRTRGSFPPLRPAQEIEALAMTPKERELYEGALTGHVHGTEEQVAAQLAEVAAGTGADELLVTTSTYDRTALLDSFERLARVAGL
ncbi:LLM class flavin-dependent oxidoreductase, partial [Streptomyces sp. NPDC059456]|uniref:LLM class flavin-dependent oxidoreductase n=1 Tax=Streptomyces sp. NPDC059456 TaxID=3346838 RepID=UPI00369D2AA6